MCFLCNCFFFFFFFFVVVFVVVVVFCLFIVVVFFARANSCPISLPLGFRGLVAVCDCDTRWTFLLNFLVFRFITIVPITALYLYCKMCKWSYCDDGYNDPRNKPPHDKTNNVAVRPAKTQISLIRVFAVRMKTAWILRYPLSAQRRLWSDWADAQADRSLRWAHMPFCWFCHEAAQKAMHRSGLKNNLTDSRGIVQLPKQSIVKNCCNGTKLKGYKLLMAYALRNRWLLSQIDQSDFIMICNS